MSFLSDAEMVAAMLDAYRRASAASEQPVIHQEHLADIVARLDLAALVREGGLCGSKLAEFMTAYLSTTTRLHHPGFLAHQVATPHPSGSVAALVDGFTNNAMAIYEMGPGAATIEYFVLNWMLQKVGWRPAPLVPGEPRGEEWERGAPVGGGVLTHGGSLANLTALLTARNQVAPESWSKGAREDLVLFAPDGAHYSIARAAGILGLGQQAVERLEVDDHGAVIAERLDGAYERVIGQGRRPMALVANACSTAVGVYDPLDEIADFCNARGLWLHVDGAHGASALVSRRHRHLLRGVHKADSLVWDAHKMLRAPVLCAALLVRDHRTLDATFRQEASYLFHEKEQPGVDFAQRTVECTKAGLGLKLFMVLGAMGERGLEEYLDRQHALALQAYEYIQSQPGLECAVRPQSTILCFRIDGSDTLQLRIRDRLNEQGRFYLSSTVFCGRRYLRMVFVNPDTTMAVVRACLESVREAAAELGG